MDSNRAHKRELLVSQYIDKIEEKLRPYRNQTDEVNKIMEWFEIIINAPEYDPSESY